VTAEFRQLGPASSEWLASIMGAPSVEEVRRRFRSGGRCYTAWVDGHLASYGWVSFDEEYVGEFNLRVRLLPGEAYVWDCFTLPAYRRHGLYSALLAHVLCNLEAGPVCRAWIGADADNVASQRGIARAGFRAVADMVLARVLAIRLVWVQGRPGMPEGAVAEARRAFLDNRDSVWLKAIELSKELAQPAGQPSDLHLDEPH
jgi:GNAT superfamily N-acetyltransferase